MSTSRRWSRTLLAAAALLGVALVGLPVRTSAQEAPADPQQAVLAVVSPIVAPACQASGTATLLVPVVGDLVTDQLGEVPIPIGELVLDSLGPVFVVCAELPGSPGSRCQLDDQIAGVWPQEIAAFVPAPGLLGNLVDAVTAAVAALGLPPQAALQDALVCSVPASVVDNTPPPDAPLLPPTPDLTPVGEPTGFGDVTAPASGGGFTTPVLGTPTTSTPVVSEPPSRPAVLAAVTRHVPGGLLSLQVAAAALLGLVLASSWATSIRAARAERR